MLSPGPVRVGLPNGIRQAMTLQWEWQCDGKSPDERAMKTRLRGFAGR